MTDIFGAPKEMTLIHQAVPFLKWVKGQGSECREPRVLADLLTSIRPHHTAC